MTCDGDIAQEEIELLRNIISKTELFKNLEVETLLRKYIDDINENGVVFLNQYLSEVAENKLSKEDQLLLVDLAFRTIEADNRIEYSEVKFFKKIRVRLSLTDEEILAKHPNKEDFLLPDIYVADNPEWNDVKFDNILLNSDNDNIKQLY